MFKYLPLLWSNLRRKPLRALLTFASIAIAFLLFGLLQTMQSALSFGAELTGIDRLVTMHKVSLIMPLPWSYVNRIRGVAGVRAVTHQTWFGGIYQDDRNQIAAIVTEADSFLDVYPDYNLRPAERDAWLADRTGVIVGKTLADRYGWKVGDTLPIRSEFYARKDGGNVWELKVSAVFDATNGDNSSLYFHYDYLNESLEDFNQVGWLILSVSDPAQAQQVARAVDALFANSSTETKTSTERAFIQGFANQMGNIAKIVTAIASAVFFTMLLVTGNTMAQSLRERINEIAILKTLGYSNLAVTLLILAESLLITAAGGAAGLAVATSATDAVGEVLQQYFPVLGMPAGAYVIGAVLMVVMGVLAAALPSIQAWRLRITDALRQA
jgi:putative ABC transport system permease protein